MKFRLALGLGLKPALPAHVVPLLPVLARRHRTHLARKLHQHGLCDDLVSSVKVAVKLPLLAACQEMKKGATRRGKDLSSSFSRVLTASTVAIYAIWCTSGSSSGLAHWWVT